MPLQKQIVEIPVGAGVDELTGTLQLNPGKWAAAENCRIVDTRTIEQRPGYAAMTTAILGGGAVAAARRLLRVGDETLLDDGNGLHTYVRDDTTWRSVDLISETTISKRIVGEHGAPTYDCRHDATWCSGMFVHAWTAVLPNTMTTNCFVRITDELTGARLAAVQWACEVTSGVRVFTVPGTTLVYVFYVNPAGDGTRQLCCRWTDIDSPSAWSAETIVTTLTGTSAWDAQPMTATSNMIIYDVAANGRVATVSMLGVITDFANLAALQHPIRTASISYDAAASRIYASYCAAGDGLRAASFTTGPLAQVFDVQVDADVFVAAAVQVLSLGQTNVTGVGARLVYSLASSIDRAAQTRTAIVTNGGVITAGLPTYHIVSAGVPRWIGTRLYVIGHVAENTAIGTGPGFMNPQDTGQYGAFLLEILESGQARAVCRIAWGQASFYTSDLTKRGGPTAVGLNVCTGGYVSSIGILSDSPKTYGSKQEGFDLFVLDWSPDYAPLGCEQDGDLVMSGGMPTVYCGDRVSEYGFNYYPVMSLVKAAAGAIPVGAYGYAVCFVHRDARGVLHRSAPVYDDVVLGAGEDEVDIWVSQYTLSTRMDSADANYPVQIELYRTVVNGQVYYHHSTAECTKSLSTYVFYDTNTVPDINLIQHRQLYTTGDVVENIAPPALRHVITHNNRLWGISCDDPDRLWFSKLQSLREAQGFNEAMTHRVPGADLVGLASLDGKLICFGKRGIWSVFGSGPNDLLQGSDLSEPQPISSEHGCIDARSICVFPGGVTFQGLDGLLYVVNSGMQVAPISMPVYDTLHNYPVINAVTYIPDDHEIRVLCSDSGATHSVVLVWNVLLDQWHKWKLKDAGGNAVPPAKSAALISWSGEPDRYAVLLTSGVVLRESGWTDPDATYPTVWVSTGPLAVQSVVGYQRLWDIGILFEKVISASHSGVAMYVYENHPGTTATWTASWSAGDTASAQSGSRLQLLAHCPLANQKCESVAVGLIWTPVGGRNLRLQGLSLRLGVKAGRPQILVAAARK